MSKFGKITAAALGTAMLALPLAAAAEDFITIGSAISLTGKYSTNGIQAQEGYDFAVEKINAAGGVNVGGKNYKIKVVYYDDESTPARTAQLAERLISQDGVQFILGPYSSATTAAIAPVTEKYGVPMVEAEGASRSLFNKGYKYIFAVLATSEQYLASSISLAAGIAEREGKKPSDIRVAMAFENDPFSQDVRAGVTEDAGKYNMQIVIDDQLPRDLSDMAATLTKVKALQPDLLVVSGHAKGAATAVRQIGEMDIHVPMIAITHCEASDVTGKFGATANGILCPTQWSPTLTYSDEFFGSAANYEKEFKAAYPSYADKEVPYQTAQASVAVYVFKDAFERAGVLDKDKVRDALAATDMSTFYGGIKFTEAGNNAGKVMVLRQIQDGQYNVVAPPEFASHKLDWPRP